MTDEESNLRKAENYYKQFERPTDTFLQRLAAWPITAVIVGVVLLLAGWKMVELVWWLV